MDAAMNSAVSALQGQQSALSTVSNNLANSGTTGYKSVTTQFISLLTEQGQSLSSSAGGVQAVVRQNLLNPGLVQSTTTSTDMAISGNGLFPASYGLGGSQTVYTRNGAFDTDAKGNLPLSGTNYYLLGWPTDTTGKILGANPDNIASLQPVNIDKLNSSAVATSTYSLQANLPTEAQSTVAGIPYTNASGGTENVNLSYVQIGSAAATSTTDATSTYLMTVTAPPGQTISDGTTANANGTNLSQLQYQVTVDSNGGAIIGIQGATPGATTQFPQTLGTIGIPASSSTAATAPVAITSGFPSVTPGDSVGPGTTALNWPASWGLNSTTVVPTWGPVSTTMAANFSQSSSFSVFDSMGVQQTFPVTWTPAGDNTWTMTVGSPTNPSGSKSSGLLQDSSGASVSSYTYMVKFNADGSLGPITALPTNSVDSTGAATNAVAPTTAAGLPELAAVWTDGATKSSGTTAIAVNLGSSGKTDGLSQSDTGQTTPLISVKSTTQDGVQYGQLTGVSVDSSGNLVAAYDNGQKVPIWKIPVVTFPNENGLQAGNDGVYSQSSLSGNYTLNQAGTNGAGSITGSALEASNVNTAQEFSNMITAQQAYSSASQVVGTDQKMFTTLMQQIQ